MEPRRSKYDTNPLDEGVADRADKEWSGRETGSADEPSTQVLGGPATREIGRPPNEATRSSPETEAPTRRIDDTYPSVFAYGQPRAATYQPPKVLDANIYQPPPAPASQIYQPPPSAVPAKPGSRKVQGLGIPEKWAVMLPYFPFGFVIALGAALVELLLVPRTETRVRFHASQGLVLQIGITAISTLLGFVDVFAGRFTGASVFSVASFVFLIIAMVRVFQGKSLHLTLLDPLTKWVEENVRRK